MSFFEDKTPYLYLTRKLPKALRDGLAKQVRQWPSLQEMQFSVCEMLTDQLPAPPHRQESTLLEMTLEEMHHAWTQTYLKHNNCTLAYKATFLAMFDAISHLHCYLVTSTDPVKVEIWDAYESPLLDFLRQHEFTVEISDYRDVAPTVRRQATVLLMHHIVTRQHLRAMDILTYSQEQPMQARINALVSEPDSLLFGGLHGG